MTEATTGTQPSEVSVSWTPERARKYLIETLEPVHVGSGETHLSGVDNVIFREEATDLPGIPGTSLAGAIRNCGELKWVGEEALLVKQRFGTANEKTGTGQQGLFRFSDARVVLFPVPSIYGPVWITEPEVAEKYLFRSAKSEQGEAQHAVAKEYLELSSSFLGEESARRLCNTWHLVAGEHADQPKDVNLGWVYLTDLGEGVAEEALVSDSRLNDFYRRALVVEPMLFRHLTNDHLEVRTSVAINDETGAAEQGLLFTYEALPRGTVLAFDIGAVPVLKLVKEGINLNSEYSALEEALSLLSIIGIGGMVTRGFGRIKVWWSEGGQ